MYEEMGYSEKVDVYAFGMSLAEMVRIIPFFFISRNLNFIRRFPFFGVVWMALSSGDGRVSLQRMQECSTDL